MFVTILTPITSKSKGLNNIRVYTVEYGYKYMYEDMYYQELSTTKSSLNWQKLHRSLRFNLLNLHNKNNVQG